MSFFKKLFFKSTQEASYEPIMVASIPDTILSQMYQDLLKSNNIPFICKLGACGIVRFSNGTSMGNDNIYVNKKDYDLAKQIYDTYINSEKNQIFN